MTREEYEYKLDNLNSESIKNVINSVSEIIEDPSNNCQNMWLFRTLTWRLRREIKNFLKNKYPFLKFYWQSDSDTGWYGIRWKLKKQKNK